MKYTFAPVAALLLVGLHAVMGAETILLWSVQEYDDKTAQVGDTVTFDFSGSAHNVFIHPSGDCDETGAIEVGTSGPVTYTFKKDDAGKDMLFACDVGGHCEDGQSVKFTVADDSSAASTARILVAPVMLLAAFFL